MKKMISLIVAALLATVVASGCKGFAKCSDTQDKAVCVEAKNFDGGLVCKWNDQETDKAKACVTDDVATAKAKCAAVKPAGADKAAKEADCKTRGGDTCKLNAAGDKCEVPAAPQA